MFIIIFIAEVFLSHQDGYKSGDESRRIAKKSHLPDRVVRRGAHVVFFALLMFTGLVATSVPAEVLGLYSRILVVIAVMLWTVADEATKPLLKNFRHFSIKDCGFNLLGAAVGGLLWMLCFS